MALKTQSKKQLRKQAKSAAKLTAATKASKKASKKAAKQVAAREDTVRNLINNEDLHDDLRDLAEAAKKAYGRVASNPQALLQDKKVHSEVRDATSALLDARAQLVKPKKKKGKFRLFLLAIVGAGAAVATVPALRTKALDLVFGPEEELDYSVGSTSSTTSPNGNGAVSNTASSPVTGS
ncbi:hypothetical protein ACVU7I_03335 [Patulibacter sp. S7RM1-6]